MKHIKPVLSYIETILSLFKESSKMGSLMLLSFPLTIFFSIDQLTTNQPVMTD